MEKSNTHLLWIKLQLMGVRFKTKKEMMHEVKQFNKFEMPISQRINMLYEDPEEFIAYVWKTRHLAKVNDYQYGSKKSLWYHAKQWFNNLIKD